MVAISHLAGPLFVALSTQDAEPELLVHQAGEMHIPKELQGRNVALNPTLLCYFGAVLMGVVRARCKIGIQSSSPFFV